MGGQIHKSHFTIHHPPVSAVARAFVTDQFEAVIFEYLSNLVEC